MDAQKEARTALQLRFRARMQADMRRLLALSALLESKVDRFKIRSETESIAHKLAGSAGLFGFERIAEMAGDVERSVEFGAASSIVAGKCRALAEAISQDLLCAGAEPDA